MGKRISTCGTQVPCESELGWSLLKLGHASVDRAGALQCVFVRPANRLPNRLQENSVFQCVSFSCKRRRRCYVYSCVRRSAYLLARRTGAICHVCRSRVSAGSRQV